MSTFDPKRFQFAMRLAPDQLFKALKSRLDEFCNWFATNRMARQATNKLRRRSGRLAGSFRNRVSGGTFKSLRWRVFTSNRYAAIHETGGIIRPSEKQWMTVPMPAVMTKTGRTRGSAESYGRDDTYVGRDARNGKLYIWQNGSKANDWAGRKLFLLTKSVSIPKRLGFFATWDAEKPARGRYISKAVTDALNDLAGGTNAS